MKRSRSEAVLTSRGLTFLDNPLSWVFYILIILIVRVVLAGIGLSSSAAWSTVNWLHGIVNILLLHYSRGHPEMHGTGEMSHSIWDMIEEDERLHRAKKFLCLCPIILFYIAVDASHWELAYVWINIIVTIAVVLPKLSFMQGMNLFGNH